MVKNFNILADRLKGVKVGEDNLTPEKLIELLKDQKEVELTVSPIHLLDDTQLTELKGTVKKEGYEEGKLAGSEIFAKELKRKAGIEREGKSLDVIYGYLTEKFTADAKVEPNQKIRELTDSLTNLQKTFETEKNQWTQTTTALQGQLEQKDIDFYATANIPSLNGIKPSHALLIYKQERQLKKDESGNIIIYKGGKPLKDQLEKNIDFTTDFTSFARENGWIGSSGRGGGSESGVSISEFKTLNDVYKYMEKNKMNPDSPEGVALVNRFKGQK